MSVTDLSTARQHPASVDRAVWTVHHRDARRTGEFLAEIASASENPTAPFLTTTITSPPYANLVNYGTPDQIGFGQSYESYLTECRTIFEDVFSWTRDEGSMWIVADTLMEPQSAGKPSRLVPLPFDLATQATAAGWTLRDTIVWRKDRTRPWASKGRLRNGFEYVLYFVKGSSFKYHVDRLRDIRGMRSWWVKYPERHNPWGMTPDNVWDIPIPVQGSWASNDLRHACPFPPELVKRIVSLSTDPGDVVFDPFSGSGMVAAVSEAEGRLPLGTELNPEFCRVYEQHVRPTQLRSEQALLDVDSLDITGTLLSLRVLKYAKELVKQLMRSGVQRDEVLGTVVLAADLSAAPTSSPYASLTCMIVVPSATSDEGIAKLLSAATRVSSVAPLSKYGVTAETVVLRLSDLGQPVEGHNEFSFYLGGRTWKSRGKIRTESLGSWLEAIEMNGVPPVLSPLDVRVELEER